MIRAILTGMIFAATVSTASANIVITEWMYNGLGTGSAGEFVELRNIGAVPIDMTGWSYDDSSQTPGSFSLSGFGIVNPGEIVILTDETAVNFATVWGLSGIDIVGGNSHNLGRNDEINIYDAGNNLIDRLTYGDENFPGTIRTQNRSGNIPASDYGFTTVQTSWVLATAGDSFGSYASTRGEIGSPGVIPEPASLALLVLGTGLLLRRR